MNHLKFALYIASVFLVASASAHIEPGVWKGVTPGGEPCTLEAFEQTFEDGTPHPLNERIRVRIAGDEFRVYHPRTVDAKRGVVAFDHDHFEGVAPMPTGSHGVVIDMAHTEKFEGPTGFRWIRDNWKTKMSAVTTCLDLKHGSSFRRWR